MNNTLQALNNYLFEQIERLNDDELSDEALDRELRKTDGIVKVSEKILANNELVFKTVKHMDEYGYEVKWVLPKMLTSSEGEADNGHQ